MFAGKKSAQIREILISESAWEEMTCLFAPSLIYVLTSNSEATISISGYARDRMVSYQEMGSGSASSVLVFMMVAGIAACFLYIGRMNHGDTEDK